MKIILQGQISGQPGAAGDSYPGWRDRHGEGKNPRLVDLYHFSCRCTKSRICDFASSEPFATMV